MRTKIHLPRDMQIVQLNQGMTNYATMNDIAFAFGVSQASVSLVLNEMLNARVFAPTRLQVKDIAQSLGDVRKLIPRTI